MIITKQFSFKMSRICVICLGDHPSFECPQTRGPSSPLLLLSGKKEKRQSSIKNFCAQEQINSRVKPEVTISGAPEKPWAFFRDNTLLKDDDFWLTQKSETLQDQGGSDVFFVKSIVPTRPIPLKVKEENQVPSTKTFANKSTSTMITVDHLITLEDHEAILVQILEQTSGASALDLPRKSPIKLKRLKKPEEVGTSLGNFIFNH